MSYSAALYEIDRAIGASAAFSWDLKRGGPTSRPMRQGAAAWLPRNTHRLVDIREQPRCFNEAAACSRGKHRLRLWSWVGTARFNEAAAWHAAETPAGQCAAWDKCFNEAAAGGMPRNSASVPAPATSCGCFNEAAARHAAESRTVIAASIQRWTTLQ